MSRLTHENAPQRPSRGRAKPAEALAALARRLTGPLERPLAWSAPRVSAVTAQSQATWMTDAQPAQASPQAHPSAEDEPGRLVRLALEGDAMAFGELIDRHERAALAVAYSATRDASLAADAVQEACLKAWHKRASLADPQRFAGWLLHIVRRCALDQLRSRKPVQSLTGAEAGPAGETHDASTPMMKREEDQRVREALDELDDESRLAVVMRYYDGCAAKEIAQVLGCSPAAVDMRLKRARDRLRQRLSDLSERAAE